MCEREKWQDSKIFYTEIQRTKNSKNNLEKTVERLILPDINTYYKAYPDSVVLAQDKTTEQNGEL